MTHQQSSTYQGSYEPSQQSETTSWYAIHCQPFKERYVAAVLQEQHDIPVYLPEIKFLRREKTKYVPLFPRYMFAQIDLHTHPPGHINASPGVVRVVTLGMVPQSIPATVISALRLQVEQINEQGELVGARFQAGQPVQIIAGPLQGLEAVFVGPMAPRARVRVLLEFMGRLNEVEIDQDALQPAEPEEPEQPSASKRPRRTRGKGRKIAS
jgi:transcription antitermination factor NusG